MSSDSHWRGRACTLALLVIVAGITLSANVAAVGTTATSSQAVHDMSQVQSNTTTQNDTATASQCTGRPELEVLDVVSVASRITPEEAGSVEANFQIDRNTPADCNVLISLTYRIGDNGFQFTGGANWEQSASTLLSTRFNVGAGEIRSISAQIKPNPDGAQVGDDVTVIASAELWYEGNRENSRQISGLRQTLTVTEETATPSPTPSPTPASEPSGEGQEPQTATPVSDNGGITETLSQNTLLSAFLVIALVGVIGIIVVGLARSGGTDIIAFGE